MRWGTLPRASIALALVVSLLAGCGPTAQPTATPTPVAPTQVAREPATATLVARPAASDTPTLVPPPTPSPAPTLTAIAATNTPTLVPPPTPTAMPTASATLVPPPTPTAMPTATATLVPPPTPTDTPTLVPPPTATPTHTATRPPACGGTEVRGYCWYVGAENASCDAVCAPHGGYHKATRTFAGSDGSPQNCRSLLKALRVPLDNFFPTTQGGIGCFILRTTSGNYFGYWDSQPTTASATSATPGRRRICACRR